MIVGVSWWVPALCHTKHFSCMISFILYNNPSKWHYFLCFWNVQWWQWGSVQLNNLPRCHSWQVVELRLQHRCRHQSQSLTTALALLLLIQTLCLAKEAGKLWKHTAGEKMPWHQKRTSQLSEGGISPSWIWMDWSLRSWWYKTWKSFNCSFQFWDYQRELKWSQGQWQPLSPSRRRWNSSLEEHTPSTQALNIPKH